MSGDDYIDYFIGMDTSDYKKEIEEIERNHMNKKLEKLKKKDLEDARKIVEELEAKEDKIRKKWDMYEDAGCRECGKKGYYIKVTDYGITSGYDKIRCDCTYIETKRYKKALKNKDVSVKEYEKKIAKFKDNYSHIETRYHSTDRSW
jgi:hypothetical protein